MMVMEWLADDLMAQIATLLGAGWDAVGYWCDVGEKTGLILVGRNAGVRAQAREALNRVKRRAECLRCAIK